jgi:hypothetical protein
LDRRCHAVNIHILVLFLAIIIFILVIIAPTLPALRRLGLLGRQCPLALPAAITLTSRRSTPSVEMTNRILAVLCSNVTLDCKLGQLEG